MKNENGFSLLELAVSAAIYITIGTVAYVTMSEQAAQMIQKVEEAQTIEFTP